MLLAAGLADARDTDAGLTATLAADTTTRTLHATGPAPATELGADAGAPRPPPRQIARFAVLRELGRGAMGVVYAGHDEELDRRVAIKLVDLGDDANPSLGRNQLLREAQAHPTLTPRRPNPGQGALAAPLCLSDRPTPRRPAAP